jgi:hypothetical protein
VWHLLHDDRSKAAVLAAEAFADDELKPQELGTAKDRAERVLANILDLFATRGPRAIAQAACAVASDIAWHAACEATLYTALPEMERGENPRGLLRQAGLVREIFGNPFQAIAVDSAWLRWNEGTTVKLAQAAYEKRRFDLLPILADALEEAGCNSDAVLSHCRQGSEHVRGCWVIDWLLANSV